MRKPRWRWSNIPIPEVYVVLLAVGVVLHLLLPLRLFPVSWAGHAAGWPMLAAGVFLAAWAVNAAADLDIARPAALVTSGPYRFSRNPMYLGWTFISLGVGLVLNSGWVLMLIAVSLLFAHYITVPREERALEQRFGERYLAYKGNVRRWL